MEKRSSRASRLIAAVMVAVGLSSCGGSDAPAEPGTATFAFRLRRFPGTEEFRISTTSPSFIADVREQLKLPASQRLKFVAGSIEAGNGGHNLGWSWHFSNASLVESAIEVCDGTPSMVEAHLDYWLDTVKSFCPWSSYAYAEI